MNKKLLGIKNVKAKKVHGQEEKTYKRPSWVKSSEEELCSDCFRVVGDRNRYRLVCLLGKQPQGMNVKKLTEEIRLTQPTITHHLNVLRSVQAVESMVAGRERIYKLNRDAHCFEECKIPY